MATMTKRLTGDWRVTMGGRDALVTVSEAQGWDEDSAEWRYTIACEYTGAEELTDDADDVRGLVAYMANEIRQGWAEELEAEAEERDDEEKDELQEAIDLIASERGGAAKLLALLKANGY